MNTLKHMKKMPLILLGVILAIILLGVSIYSFTKNTNPSTDTNKTATPINPNITPVPMRISFDPATIKLASSGENKISTDIKLDVGPVGIRSVKILVLCDPKRVKNLNITQKRDRYSAMSYAFADSQAVINQQTCEGTLALEIPADASEQPGVGVIAELSATVLGSAPTDIVILPQSTGATDNSTLQLQTHRVNLELTP